MQNDRYALKQVIGEGTHKRVHLAVDTHLDREVALAFVKTAGLEASERGRIRDEARDLARLGDHPHIVTLHDILEDDGYVVLVTEYLAGGDLKARIGCVPGGRLELDETLRIADHLTRALEHAHARGVLHRDLNPANVWLTSDGTAKLGDFGLAVSQARSRLIRDGFLVTAVAYMSPEQALGRPADARSDLYSLGALLYELVTGRPPFLGDDAVSVLSQHIYTTPVAPSWHAPGLPAALEALIIRLLAKTPEDRPQTAAAVCEVLAVVAAVESGGGGATAHAQLNPLDRLASGLFVGRDEAMAELRAGVEETFGNGGACFMLTGDPGIGKTRCAEEIATYARLRNVRVLTGRCVEGEGAPAYWPWIQILRELAAQLGLEVARVRFGSDALDLEDVVPLLFAQAEGDTDTPGSDDALSRRFRFFDTVARLLRQEARSQPLMIVLDDLHRADTPSLMLLQHLVRESTDAGVVVVGTYRDVEVDAAHPLAAVTAELAPQCREIQLTGLGHGGLARFIEIATGTAPDADVAHAIHELTGGNPLFLTEVVRLLAAEGALEAPLVARADRIARAPGVRHTIGQRLDRLSPPTLELLKRASVIGREFDVALIQKIDDDGDRSVMAGLDEAIAARMVEADDVLRTRFRFGHVLIRDALYEGLAGAERALQHRHVAEALAHLHAARIEPHLAEIAFHYLQALPAAPELAEKAVRYAAAAGDLERGQLAYEEASEHYAAALQALERTLHPPKRRAEILCGLGEMRWAAGETEEARRAFAEAADVARKLEAPHLLARAAFGFAGRTDATLEVDHTSVALMEEALAAMPERDDPLRAQLTSRLATGVYFSPDRAHPERLAREGLAMAERLDDPATLAYALSAVHYVLWGPGTARERLEVADRQLAVGERSGAREVAALGHFGRFTDLLELGEVAAAEVDLAAHGELSADLRQPFFEWLHIGLRSLRALLVGELDECERLLHEGMAAGQRARTPNAVTLFGGQLYFLRREQGRIGELEDAISAMVEDHPTRPLFRFALAHLLAESGNEARARSLLDQLAARDFDDLARDMSFLDSLWLATQVCVRLGDKRIARRIYDLLLPYAENCIVVTFAAAWCGSVSHALGMLAGLLDEYDEAERHFERALRVHLGAGARPLAAHTRRDHAVMLRARGGAGDTDRAAELAGEAAETYRALGMTTHIEATESLLAGPPRAKDAEAGRFRFVDGEWELAFAGQTVRARDVRGLHYLARLIDTPDVEVHVTDLADAAGRVATATSLPADESLQVIRAERGTEMLDVTAREQYKTRALELRAELEEAEARHDLGRVERTRAELEMIEGELAAAFGLAGRARRSGDDVERARKAVSNRIRDAIRRVDKLHPRLGRHLAASVRTGTWCAYRPEVPVSWHR